MSGPMLLEVEVRSSLDERLLDTASAALVAMILRPRDPHAYLAGLEAFRPIPPSARWLVELAVETELAANGVPVPPMPLGIRR